MEGFTAEDLSTIGGTQQCRSCIPSSRRIGCLSQSLAVRRSGTFLGPYSCIRRSFACYLYFAAWYYSNHNGEYYCWRGDSIVFLFLTGKGGHSHSQIQPMEKMAVAGQVLVPALSPCATTLPVFLAIGNSSSMMVLAIIVLLFSTITVMMSLVALSFYGASQQKVHWVEQYDKLLVGSVLCFVRILTLIFQTTTTPQQARICTGKSWADWGWSRYKFASLYM